jgi:hypothetical protein
VSRIIAVLCEKGGTWKTALATLLFERLRAERLNITIADVDFLNSGLITEIFPDALRVNPLYRTELAELFRRPLNGQSLLIDGGANVGFRLYEFFADEEPKLAEELFAAGVKITIIVPLTHDSKAQKSPSIYRQMFPRADFIIAFPRGTFGDFADEPVRAPEGFQDCPSFDIPEAPGALVCAYLKNKRSFAYFAGALEPEYAMLRGFALEYLETFNHQLDRVIPMLKS